MRGHGPGADPLKRRPLKDYKVVSEIHHLKSDQDQSLVDKAKQATGLSDDIDSYIPGLPVVAFMFSDEFRNEYPRIKQRNVQLQMRQKSWIIPNYSLPANAEGEEVLRVVFRETFHEDMGEPLSPSPSFPSRLQLGIRSVVLTQCLSCSRAPFPRPRRGDGEHDGGAQGRRRAPRLWLWAPPGPQ